jgi:Flp pilus assembly pilin Flp
MTRPGLPVTVRVVLPTTRGQGLVEYGLLLGLTSLLTIVWLVVFGGAIAETLGIIAEAIDRATGG